jgi:hypothetical protein
MRGLANWYISSGANNFGPDKGGVLSTLRLLKMAFQVSARTKDTLHCSPTSALACVGTNTSKIRQPYFSPSMRGKDTSQISQPYFSPSMRGKDTSQIRQPYFSPSMRGNDTSQYVNPTSALDCVAKKRHKYCNPSFSPSLRRHKYVTTR